MAYTLTDKEWRRIVEFPSVRARLRLVAEQVARRTEANLRSAGSAGKVTVEVGTRSDGRAYARVSHNDRFGEYGTEDIPRHRALGRAVGTK